VAVYSKADQTLLANNQITASGASNYGVRLGDAANVTFRDNRVIQEAVPDSSDNTPQGLLLSSTENAEVQGNVFEGVDSGQAVLVSNQAGNTSSVTVTDNDITGFSNGVFLFENKDEINNATVTDNAISDTTDTGISAVDTSGSDGFGNINGETTAQAQADALLSGNTVNSVTVEDVTVSDSE
jgi:nitrous oxidase accessory protein NosD